MISTYIVRYSFISVSREYKIYLLLGAFATSILHLKLLRGDNNNSCLLIESLSVAFCIIYIDASEPLNIYIITNSEICVYINQKRIYVYMCMCLCVR